MILQKPVANPFAGLNERTILLATVTGDEIIDEADFLLELLLAKFRITMTARFPNNYKRTYCIVDESQRLTGANLPSLIRQYRKVGVSTWVITQGLSGWTENLAKVVIDNYSGFTSFSPRDEPQLGRIFSPFTEADFVSMRRHEALVRITLTDHTTLPPFIVRTLNIERPADEARLERIRQRSRQCFTRPRQEVERYIDRLLAPEPPKPPFSVGDDGPFER